MARQLKYYSKIKAVWQFHAIKCYFFSLKPLFQATSTLCLSETDIIPISHLYRCAVCRSRRYALARVPLYSYSASRISRVILPVRCVMWCCDGWRFVFKLLSWRSHGFTHRQARSHCYGCCCCCCCWCGWYDNAECAGHSSSVRYRSPVAAPAFLHDTAPHRTPMKRYGSSFSDPWG